MKQIKKILGEKGEKVAASFLRKKGYKILKKNIHSRFGEIDIVAQKDDELIFVEVKTRDKKKVHYTSAKDAVTKKKQEKMLATIGTLLSEMQMAEDVPWRCDVMTIEVADRVATVTHYPYAFEGE